MMILRYSPREEVEKRIGWEARTAVAYDVGDVWGGLTDNKVYKDTGKREMEAQNLRTLRE